MARALSVAPSPTITGCPSSAERGFANGDANEDEVDENDQDKLIVAMTYVRDVRVKTDRYDNLFQPLRDTVSLLKKFGITMAEETIELLEMVPFKWEDTKKITLNAREQLGPLQSLQQDKVRERTEEFRGKMKEFSDRFHNEGPFNFELGVDEAYKSLVKFHIDLSELEEQGDKINQQQELFEVAVTNWRDLKACRTELGMLKTGA